jgi:hypothetical protein
MKEFIVETIISIIVVYLIGSFIFLSFNPYEWSVTGIIILMLVLGKVLGDFYGEKEQD